MIKFPGTIPGRNRPEATAHGAWRPATRDRPKSWLGHGLAAQPNGTTGLRGLLQRASAARAGAVITRRPRAGRRSSVLAGGSAVARRWQGVAGDLEGVTGKVAGKEERAGAHQNGGSTVRREESSGTAAFADGEGALVGGDSGCGVLQHRCERGELGLAPIWE
jgi:hypothetical protein